MIFFDPSFLLQLSLARFRKNLHYFFVIQFFFSTSLALSIEDQSTEFDGIVVDLRNPLYEDGTLTTDQGGVITAPQLRIQATRLIYKKKMIDNEPILTLEAEGQLIVQFGDYVFVGKKLFYDFLKREGIILQGKTEIKPWFFGGEKFELRSDGSYLIHEGYVTTSERDVPDWGIYSNLVCLEDNDRFKASQVHLRFFNYSVLWIPSLKANLDSVFDSPIRYRFRWGGRQGPRFGLTYEIFSWGRWKTFVRFDYRLTRGPGGGIETHYLSSDHTTQFQSINYLSKDSSIIHPHEKARYRFEGIFRKSMDDEKTKILFTYDKVSDKDISSSYYDRDFDFDTSERTQLLIRRQENQFIANFYARIRINSFQTVKQELPTLNVHFKPLELKNSGMIFSQWASASYLDFKYSKHLFHVRDYTSTRFNYQPVLYRPFVIGKFLTLTPELGAITLLYGNSPSQKGQWAALGKVGIFVQTQLYRYYGIYKHVVEPYAFYRYYSTPTSSPNQHDIFDMTDGICQLNYLSFGLKNAVYSKQEVLLTRLFFSNIYTYAFFDQKKMRQVIPRVYGQCVFFTIPTLKHTMNTAWNLEHHEIDFLNIRSEWTLNSRFAIALEFRYRGPYSWRKVDNENFFLDVFRNEKTLRHSSLSDRRDTLLVHFFYQLHPNWACEFISRQGWNRFNEPTYLEFEFDLLTTIQTAWHLRLSFQHQENDDRIAMYVNVGLKKPDVKNFDRPLRCYD